MRWECDKLVEFNKAFEINYSDEPVIGSIDIGELRIRLLEEEVREYAEAVRNNDLVEVLDALGDIA